MPTPDDVVEYKEPTEDFLCPLEANTYGLTFLSFVMKDYSTKQIIFSIGGDTPAPTVDLSKLKDVDVDSLRRIRYDFSAEVLRMPIITTTLTFSNGPKPLEKFKMIERHYFRDHLIKSFDFDFGFVIPNTTNTWESTYPMPPLSPALIAEIIAHPYEVKSDSFYFAGDELIMHNKAEYRYFDPDAPAAMPVPVASTGAGGGAGADEKPGGKTDDADDEPAAKDTADDHIDAKDAKK